MIKVGSIVRILWPLSSRYWLELGVITITDLNHGHNSCEVMMQDGNRVYSIYENLELIE